MPSDFSNKRRGWEGEHLELSREQPTAQDLSLHAAVNLGQFRNEQIGVGYQAKHVIRQRSLPDTCISTSDATQLKVATALTQAKRKSDKLDKLYANPTRKSRLQKYLMCDGLRKFRKELAAIESST